MDKYDQFIGKVIGVGNAVGIVIPDRNMTFSGLKKGDLIKVMYTKQPTETTTEEDKEA